jgi:hypothetical protein
VGWILADLAPVGLAGRPFPAWAWGVGRASGIPQGSVYARVGDVLAVIEALGIDTEQDFDAVPGPFGDPGRGTPAASQSDTAAWRRSQGRSARGEATCAGVRASVRASAQTSLMAVEATG